MPTSAEASKVARLPIPLSGSRFVPVSYYLFVLTFTILAVYYLVYFYSMPASAVAASIIWLILVALTIWSGISDARSIKKYMVGLLGAFSKQHFVWALSEGNEGAILRFGYELLGCEFHELQIQASAVMTVDWRTGQATQMAGHDMNDWHVALWYRDPNNLNQRLPGLNGKNVHLVGPYGRKGDVAPFGQSLVAFLKGAGIKLEATNNPDEFKATSE